MRKLITILLATAVIMTFSACQNYGNSNENEISALIGVSQEEVHEKIGAPQDTLNGTDVYTLNGKSIHISYDDNKLVCQINFNGEYVITNP